LRRPVEFALYTSIDYTQVLDDHEVLASIGTVGDALDNALAESFVDSYKTELISDRVWRSRAEVELASVKWVAWFNQDRLHSSIGDIPPIEFEALHAPNPVDLSVAAIASRAADGLTTSRVATVGVDFVAQASIASENALVAQNGSAQAATTAVKRRKAAAGLSDR
jgi:Integrase core domain